MLKGLSRTVRLTTRHFFLLFERDSLVVTSPHWIAVIKPTMANFCLKYCLRRVEYLNRYESHFQIETGCGFPMGGGAGNSNRGIKYPFAKFNKVKIRDCVRPFYLRLSHSRFTFWATFLDKTNLVTLWTMKLAVYHLYRIPVGSTSLLDQRTLVLSIILQEVNWKTKNMKITKHNLP